MTRSAGYYFATYGNELSIIVEWFEGKWWVMGGDEAVPESYLSNISPHPITPEKMSAIEGILKIHADNDSPLTRDYKTTELLKQNKLI